MRNLHFKDPQIVGEGVFDKTSIFYTFSAHTFFSFYDKPFFDFLKKYDGDLFDNDDSFAEQACETCTRFLSYAAHIDATLADGPSAIVSAVSAQRDVKKPTVTNESKHVGSRRKFTGGDLVRIQEQWYNKTGEWSKQEHRAPPSGRSAVGRIYKAGRRQVYGSREVEGEHMERESGQGIDQEKWLYEHRHRPYGDQLPEKIVAHYAKDDDCKAQNRYAIAGFSHASVE